VKEEKEKVVAASARAGSAENKEIKSLREQLAVSKSQAQELMSKLENVCKNEANINIILYGNSFPLTSFSLRILHERYML
jgi:hypothetical protein